MNFFLPIVAIAAIMSTAVQAQSNPAGTDQVPKTPDERNWYPQTNIYSPETLIGVWFWIDGSTLRQQTQQPAQGLVIDTVFIQAQAYSYSRTKETEASAKIPAFASTSLKDQEAQSLTVDDISVSTLKSDLGDPFCREWPTMKRLRTWAVGDKLIYVVSDLLSHVAWKVGKIKDMSAGAGLGNYFSAEGQQYEQTSISAILPAQSFPQTIYKAITLDDLTDKSCASLQSVGHDRTMSATFLPGRLKVTSAVLLPAEK